MSDQILIENLTKKEKLQLMEKLWEDISQDADYSPPMWHQKVLEEREKKIKEKKESFTDWKEAKKDIRNQVL